VAVTKKELARFEELLTEAALRRTSAEGPDVPAPSAESDTSFTQGFLYVGEWSDFPRVEPACSSRVGHCSGRNDKTTTQGPRHLFSTRLKALKALRAEVEKCAAKRLRAIDRMIEAETAQPKGGE